MAKIALIGGETAEMPGMYDVGTYDLAGFAVGEVCKDDVIDGSKVQSGDSIVELHLLAFIPMDCLWHGGWPNPNMMKHIGRNY